MEQLKRRYNIALVIGDLSYGGAENQLCELAIRLNKKKFNPVVFSLSKERKPYGLKLEKEGIKVYYLKRWMHFDLIRLVKLASLFKKEKIDLVHSFLFTANAYSFFASKLSRRKRQISTVRSMDSYRAVLMEKLDKHVLRHSCQVIFNSYEACDYYRFKFALDEKRLSVIHNGIDTQRFNNLTDSNKIKNGVGISPQARVVGTIWSLKRQKNIPLFLRTVSKIVKKYNDVEFALIGGGPMLKEFMHLAKNMKLQKRIHFMGFQEEVADSINIFDIFILTSTSESLPNVLLEAAAAKKPIICTDVGGCREAVQDKKTGFVVPLSNEDLFVERVEYLLNNLNLRNEFGDRGRSYVERNFSLEKMIEETQRLYTRILKQ